MYTILFFAGARSKIEAAIFFHFDFLLVLLQYTYFRKLYIDLLTKNGIFIKNILPDVCIKTYVYFMTR